LVLRAPGFGVDPLVSAPFGLQLQPHGLQQSGFDVHLRVEAHLQLEALADEVPTDFLYAIHDLSCTLILICFEV
jgi:hypothetical protein